MVNKWVGLVGVRCGQPNRGRLSKRRDPITNMHYRPMVDRIRSGLKDVFNTTIDFKAGYLLPVDWRPREYNSPPDAVCNWVLSSRADMGDMDADMVVAAVRNRQCLQIHCDGGYDGTVGSAAFVVHVVEPRTGNITRAGYRGCFMVFAESSFHAELTAIDNAIQFVLDVKRIAENRPLKRKVIFQSI